MKGMINYARPEPDTFVMQCQAIIKKELHERYMRTETRKRFKSWKYITRFLPSFRTHKSFIDTEQNLAKFLRQHYGIGIFNVLFKGNVMYVSAYKRRKYKKKPRIKWVWQKRAQVAIIDSYDSKTGEDFSYKFIENKMNRMPFWKGTDKKETREDLNKVEIPEIESIEKQEMAQLEIR